MTEYQLIGGRDSWYIIGVQIGSKAIELGFTERGRFTEEVVPCVPHKKEK